MIAGWIRVVGQVTAVVTGSLVTWEIAPITDQRSWTAPAPGVGRSRGLRQVIVPIAVVTLLDMRQRGA
jgi:hypothetical protein